MKVSSRAWSEHAIGTFSSRLNVLTTIRLLGL